MRKLVAEAQARGWSRRQTSAHLEGWVDRYVDEVVPRSCKGYSEAIIAEVKLKARQMQLACLKVALDEAYPRGPKIGRPKGSKNGEKPC